MEIFKTLNFLKTTRLALITCADEALLNNFFNFISTASNFSAADVSVETEISTSISPKEITQKLATTMEHSKTKNIFVPFKCDKYSKLRSVYFYLPENVKSDVQIFVLRETEACVKLECELGLLQGSYILYDYTKTTGTFKEKE